MMYPEYSILNFYIPFTWEYIPTFQVINLAAWVRNLKEVLYYSYSPIKIYLIYKTDTGVCAFSAASVQTGVSYTRLTLRYWYITRFLRLLGISRCRDESPNENPCRGDVGIYLHSRGGIYIYIYMVYILYVGTCRVEYVMYVHRVYTLYVYRLVDRHPSCINFLRIMPSAPVIGYLSRFKVPHDRYRLAPSQRLQPQQQWPDTHISSLFTRVWRSVSTLATSGGYWTTMATRYVPSRSSHAITPLLSTTISSPHMRKSGAIWITVSLWYCSTQTQWGLTPPISTVGPTDSEVAVNQALVEELKRQNSFESSEESQKRVSVLQQLQKITEEFVRQVCTAKGLSEVVVRSSGGKICTFGSYRLGVYGPGKLSWNHIPLGCKHI